MGGGWKEADQEGSIQVKTFNLTFPLDFITDKSREYYPPKDNKDLYE